MYSSLTTNLVAGVDEAGRGPLAGPVVAAAVILRRGVDIDGLDDSKKLSTATRERVAGDIRRVAVDWAVAWADRAEIDALNILGATMLAMRRAIAGLRILPGNVIIDGNRVPDMSFLPGHVTMHAVVRADGTVPSVSAASVLAKTARDRIMVDLDRCYPAYAFARHKGYGTDLHRERLREHGPCCEHRRSFAPLRTAP